MKKGFLISFEGGEACGKSTQIRLFEEYLKNKGVDYIKCREPGGTDVGEQIRNILLHSKAELSAQTEFLLFSASRSKLIDDVVRPALQEGRVVVMDRYYDSSFAYQGYAGDLELEDVENITHFAIGEGAKPDLTILLDIDYDSAMKRKASDVNLAELDRMERKGRAYHERVREGYMDLARKNKDRIVVIDASKTVKEIQKEIVETFEERMKS